jgi:hypothetical protein
MRALGLATGRQYGHRADTYTAAPLTPMTDLLSTVGVPCEAYRDPTRRADTLAQ